MLDACYNQFMANEHDQDRETLAPDIEHARYQRERIIASSDKYFVTAGSQLDEDVAEVLWRKNQEGFTRLNESSISRQNMTRDEYDADVANPDVLKYTVYAKADEGKVSEGAESAIGMLFVHADARNVDWVNQQYMQSHLPGFAEGKYVYISTLVIEQNHRGIDASGLLIRGVGEDLYPGNALMDFAKANDALPGYIEHCLHSDTLGSGGPLEADVVRLGAESYRAIDPSRATDLPGEIEGISVVNQIGRDEAEALWPLYEARAAEVEHNKPGTQTLTNEQFLDYCADTRVAKIVAESDVTFLAQDLAALPHLSEDYVRAQTGATRANYIIGAGVMESGGTPNAARRLAIAVHLAKEAGAVMLYDADERSEQLNQQLAHMCGQESSEIDHQSYWIIRSRHDAQAPGAAS